MPEEKKSKREPRRGQAAATVATWGEGVFYVGLGTAHDLFKRFEGRRVLITVEEIEP